ncbi:MAG: hypothetical protein WAO12_03080, partial [Venatoribacter sp.]
MDNKLYNTLGLALLSAVILFVYFFGLSGDYVFDDPANILDNEKLKLQSLQFGELSRAFFSGDAGPLGRPISMLSFALNYYATGFDPFYFKLTNLLIHLANTLLVWLIARALFSFSKQPAAVIGWGSLLAAALWGLHPLNLTSVLYVVQRMVSLSTLFGLLAVFLYVQLRSQNNHTVKATWLYALGIVISLAASAFSKESGLLFLPLIYITELFILKGKNTHSQQDIKIANLKLTHWLWVSIAVALAVILLKLPKYLAPEAFLSRGFTLEERVLTETRVLFYYLKLFIFPRITELSLYHDDFTISHSFTQPISTLYAVLGLAGITAACLALYKKTPWLLFAWLWFLIGHAMESTVFSLELIHEHRNYFAIIGFALLVPLAIQQSSYKLKPIFIFVAVVYTLYLGFVTWQRAQVWSNLVDHAAFEAATHPNSERANYQLARIYIKLMVANENDEDKKAYYANLANHYLERARHAYQANNSGWFAQLHVDYYLDKEPTDAFIEELAHGLATKPMLNGNVGFLSSFVGCQIDSFCKMPHNTAITLLASALNNPTAGAGIKAEINKLIARYFLEVAGDFEKAEEFFHDALELKNDINGHLLLAQTYRLWNKFDAAQAELEAVRALDSTKTWE